MLNLLKIASIETALYSKQLLPTEPFLFRHEGRTWYSTHRGRLWIAAAAKTPDQEEVKKVEDFYRSYYEGKGANSNSNSGVYQIHVHVAIMMYTYILLCLVCVLLY